MRKTLTRYFEWAQSHGDDMQLWLIEGAGHFDLIAPVVAQTRLLEPCVISHDRDQRTAWAVQIESWITCPH